MNVRPAIEHSPQDEGPETTGEAGGFGIRLVVAPVAGRLRHLPPSKFHQGGEWVSLGQTVAVVQQGSVEVEVRSPIEARVGRILVRDDEPVVPGQALMWLEEDPAAHGVRKRSEVGP